MLKKLVLCSLSMVFLWGCQIIERWPQQKAEIKQPNKCVNCGDGISSINTQCIFSNFALDDNSYLTRQLHQICKCDNSMLITSFEPGGKIVWHLDETGVFQLIESGIERAEIAGKLLNREQAIIILSLLKANINNLAVNSEKTENIFGQWYVPAGSNSFGTELYRGLYSNNIEMAKSKKLAGKAYNFRYDNDLDNSVPTTIEIFNIDRGYLLGKKLIGIEYFDFSLE